MSARLGFRWGIASMLTTCVVVSVAVLMAITTSLDIRRERSSSLAQLEEQGVLLIDTLRHVLADPLYFRDVDGLDDISKIVAGQPDVLYVQVFDPDGRLLVDTEQQGRYGVGVIASESKLAAVKSGETVVALAGGVLDIAAPVVARGQVLGGIRLGLSTKSIEARISAMTLQRLWQSAVIVAVGMTISYFVARYFVQPIKGLVAATHRVSEGSFDYAASHRRSDEIGELAVSFENMINALRESRLGLEERTQELEDVNTRLLEAQDQLIRTEKLAAVGQLAGGVAHDLRNPLGAISNAVYYLKRKLGASELAQSNPRIGQFLQIMADEVSHSNGIITDLMSFTRVNASNLSPVDLAEVIESAISGLVPRENIRVAERLEPDLPEVLADPEQIRRVFINLAANAQDAMPDGGDLTVHAQRVDGFVQVAFSDTGMGIPAENLKKVLDPLFTTKTRGTGLGLSICHQIVSQHNGTIEVESTEGEGATFTVKLPLNGDGGLSS